MWRLLARQFTHRFAVLLWVACGLALLGGMPPLAVAIVVVVVVNGGFAFVQEYRADRAADGLRDLMPASASVRRDGVRFTVPAAELVPGDLVVLEAGDRVSADLLVVAASGLAIDESLLTGESVPRRAGPRSRSTPGRSLSRGRPRRLSNPLVRIRGWLASPRSPGTPGVGVAHWRSGWTGWSGSSASRSARSARSARDSSG